jgi:hypothetical protein
MTQLCFTPYCFTAPCYCACAGHGIAFKLRAAVLHRTLTLRMRRDT